jgi:hypothetical protein
MKLILIVFLSLLILNLDLGLACTTTGPCVCPTDYIPNVEDTACNITINNC